MTDIWIGASAGLKIAYVEQANRFEQVAKWLSQRKDNYVSITNFTGKSILREELATIIDILVQKGIMTPDEFLERVIAKMNDRLFQMQTEFGVIITPNGVLKSSEEGGDDG